jgi:hypothetical protein
MDLDHGACYRAICLRDPRFDGRFFTGVKTTGIYCRPICPARTPRSENVTFYLTVSCARSPVGNDAGIPYPNFLIEPISGSLGAPMQRNTYGLQPEREADVLMHHVLQTFGGTPNADCEVVLLY